MYHLWQISCIVQPPVSDHLLQKQKWSCNMQSLVQSFLLDLHPRLTCYTTDVKFPMEKWGMKKFRYDARVLARMYLSALVMKTIVVMTTGSPPLLFHYDEAHCNVTQSGHDYNVAKYVKS